MHQVQVASLARHPGPGAFNRLAVAVHRQHLATGPTSLEQAAGKATLSQCQVERPTTRPQAQRLHNLINHDGRVGADIQTLVVQLRSPETAGCPAGR